MRPGVLWGPPGGASIPSHGMDTHTVCGMAAYPTPIQQHHKHPALTDHPRATGSQDGGDVIAGVCSQGGKAKGKGNEQDSSPNHARYPGGTEGVATLP